MLGVILVVVIVAVWTCFYARSKNVLERIFKEFKNYSHKKQKQALKKYKRNLRFVKLTKITAPKLAWILGSFILGIVSGSGIVPFLALVIFWIVYHDKLKKPVDPRFRALDEWVIIANQTIINK